jgi:hypothetical protein
MDKHLQDLNRKVKDTRSLQDLGTEVDGFVKWA